MMKPKKKPEKPRCPEHGTVLEPDGACIDCEDPVYPDNRFDYEIIHGDIGSK